MHSSHPHALDTHYDRYLNPHFTMSRPVDDLDTEYAIMQAHMPRNFRNYADYLDFCHDPLPIHTVHATKRYKERKNDGMRPVYAPGTHRSVVITYLPDTDAPSPKKPQFIDRHASSNRRTKTKRNLKIAYPRGKAKRKRAEEIQAHHGARLQRNIDAVKPKT